MKIRLVTLKGGPGSGHRGHAGRPGARGGSLPGTVAVSGRVSPVTKPKPPTGSKFKHNQLGGMESKKDRRIVERAAATLPQEHLDMVGSIESGLYKRANDFGGTCSGVYIELYNHTETRRRMWDRNAVRHEIGHAVHSHMSTYGAGAGDFHIAVKSLYVGKAKERGGVHTVRDSYENKGWRGKPLKGFPSAYSQVSGDELFAESYAMYVKNPATLMERAPDVYAFMRDRVFDGLEYTNDES